MVNKKTILISAFVLFILVFSSFVNAHGSISGETNGSMENNGTHSDETELGKSLIEAKVKCEDLNEEQLEAIGEYIMEQMHPGEQHDLMHRMMGIKENTTEHREFHVGIARKFYCGNEENFMEQFDGMGCPMMGGMMYNSNWLNYQTKKDNLNPVGFMGMMSPLNWIFAINVVVLLILIAIIVILISKKD